MLAILPNIFSPLLLIGLLNLAPLADNPSASPLFPSDLVAEVSGHFKAGGLVAMQLQNGVSLTVDGRAINDHHGLAVFGYGREAGKGGGKNAGKTKLVFALNGKPHVFWQNLQPRDYDIQYIEGVAPKYVTPPPEMLTRIKAEGKQKRAARISTLSHNDMRQKSAPFSDGFIWPVKGRISGVYGSQRFFNGQPKRPHYGIDIAAPKGTPIKAMQAGRVTLAEQDMYYEGGLIFIDHGLGVVSAYLHLSDIAVRAEQMVAKGEIIGAVGSVGRSTGAHLDWRVFWRDKRLDPALLVRPLGKP